MEHQVRIGSSAGYLGLQLALLEESLSAGCLSLLEYLAIGSPAGYLGLQLALLEESLSAGCLSLLECLAMMGMVACSLLPVGLGPTRKRLPG